MDVFYDQNNGVAMMFKIEKQKTYRIRKNVRLEDDWK